MASLDNPSKADKKAAAADKNRGSMEDGKIVDLFWQRSEDAIKETQAKYGKLCFSIAFGVLKNNEDSEECVNDTYVRTWNSIPEDRPDFLGAYVSKITRRLAIDKYRMSAAKKRAAETVSLFDELSESLPDKTGDIMADRIIIRDTLTEFIYSLTPENRLIFMRRYWYCDSARAIASMMRMTETGVNRRLDRMRRKLKEALGKAGIEE